MSVGATFNMQCMYTHPTVLLSLPDFHSSPTKVGLSNRRPWRKIPRLGYSSRTVSTPITRVEEEEVYKHPNSGYIDDSPCFGAARPIVEVAVSGYFP